MSDSGRESRQDLIDRFSRGEPTDSRGLAQDSLASPELFDELTSAALGRAALDSPAVADRLRRSMGQILPVRTRMWAAVIASAAALGAISIYLLRSGSARRDSAGLTTAPPALAGLAKPGQPVLLAALLKPETGASTFRGGAAESRAPQATGAVLSIEDGVAVINLGSLDGLTKGAELPVDNGGRSTPPAGRIVLTAVFREHSRGRASGDIRVGATVHVPAAAHLEALLEQVSVLNQRGDSAGAEDAAEKGARFAETASAVSAPRRAEAWNALGVLRLLRGNIGGAETPLRQALAASPKSGAVWARAANNLGVLAELRGERDNAERSYREALDALSAVPDSAAAERQAVAVNLARIRTSH